MDRKTIIAFGLIILVFLLLPYYYKLFVPESSAPDSSRVQATTQTGDSLGLGQQTPAAAVQPAEAPPLAAALDSGMFSLDSDPQSIVVETPLYRMVLSTRGAVLTGCRMKKYAGQADGNVEIIRSGSQENLNLVLYQNGQPLDLRSTRFAADVKELRLGPGGIGAVTFAARSPSGAVVEKKFQFSGDSYLIGLQASASGITDLDSRYELYWGSGLAITEADTAQDIYYSQAYALMGTELEKFNGKGDREMRGGAEGETHWVAQRSKYFEVAMRPTAGPAGGVKFGLEAQPLLGKHRPKVFSMALSMKDDLSGPGGEFTIYCGPLDRKLLTQFHPQLEATMNWGWKIIEPFSKTILWALQTLHRVIPNYGVVLVVFSVLIKVLLWPLTAKSTRSMSRMAALQPKMKELQEKYKPNPERLNKAMMQLYKDEKVNPFSGCWPMLLQMPLLYGLFIVFRSTIELRQAPFMLWIQDLSMPDVVAHLPFNVPMYGSAVAILPVAMGITQFLMSKAMITDPKQKFNVYFMPVFMVLIFNTLPSGLNLYYALFNLWSYLQQVMMKKQGLIPSLSSGGK